MAQGGGGSIVPFVGPWWQTLLMPRSSSSSSGSHTSAARPVDRALGVAATVGLSLVILRLVAQAVKVAKRNNGHDNTFSFQQVIQELVRGLFHQIDEEEKDGSSSSPSEDSSPSNRDTVLHLGSCHCRAVTFELVAPKTLEAIHGPGKISYAHTPVRANNFRFRSGVDKLQIYYVSVPAGRTQHGVEPTVGAHTFCSRCGVHILHAVSPTSTVLNVNVCCVDGGGNKPRIQWNQRHNLSYGVPVEKQWDDENDDDEAGDENDDDNHDMVSSNWRNNEAEEQSTTLPSSSHSKLDEPSSVTPPEEGTPSEDSWKDCNFAIPGTPSTVGTVGTDSLVPSMPRCRSLLGTEHDSATSSDELDALSLAKPLLPPLNTSLPRTTTMESSSSTTTTPTTATPMMRDQLKYYISKHLPSPVDGPKDIQTEGDSQSS